jgi:hypothetical protein
VRSEQEVKELERKIEAFQDKWSSGSGVADETMLDVVRWVLGVDDSSLEQFIKDQDMEV